MAKSSADLILSRKAQYLYAALTALSLVLLSGQVQGQTVKLTFACKSLRPLPPGPDGRSRPAMVRQYAETVAEAKKASRYDFGDVPIDCREAPEYWAVGQPLPSGTFPESVATPSPFARMTMGEYLDAIFNADVDEVRRLDREYMGAAVRDFQGAFGNNPIWKKLLEPAHLERVTLVVPAIREYMEDYGSTYKKCLRKDAVTFTLTRTTQSQTTGISRTTNTGVYSVNQEFAQAFRATSTVGPVDTQSEALDYAFGPLADAKYGSPLAKIRTGVQQAMAAYRCDDAVIKQFESRLLEMFSTITKGKK